MGSHYKNEILKLRKYVKRYDFVSFARRVGDKYGKNFMDTAAKAGIYATKTCLKE